MEIYCERVKDLLNPKSAGNLRVRYKSAVHSKLVHSRMITFFGKNIILP